MYFAVAITAFGIVVCLLSSFVATGNVLVVVSRLQECNGLEDDDLEYKKKKWQYKKNAKSAKYGNSKNSNLECRNKRVWKCGQNDKCAKAEKEDNKDKEECAECNKYNLLVSKITL